jgi:hypothetical protein
VRRGAVTTDGNAQAAKPCVAPEFVVAGPTALDEAAIEALAGLLIDLAEKRVSHADSQRHNRRAGNGAVAQ